MVVDFEFELNDEVSVKGQKKKGKVTIRKYEDSFVQGKFNIVKRYYVDCGGYSKSWFDEDQLDFANEEDIKVSVEAEKVIYKAQVDGHLLHKRIESAREIFMDLSKLEKGEVAE
jgi:hypothetical protein